MGGGSGRHRRCALARGLARRSHGIRRAALGRHPVFGRLSRRGGGRLAGAHGDQRAGGRAGGFGRAAPGNDRAGSGVCRRRARGLGLRAVAAARSGAGRPRSPIRSRSPPRRAGTVCRFDASLEAFVLAQPANLVSAGAASRCRSGRRTARRFSPRSCRAFGLWRTRLKRARLADLGGCAFRSDIAAMRHETQYSRLFRS